MRVFRAMCNEEAEDTLKSSKLSFVSRFKWFGTSEFISDRVQDGKFNNSKYVGDRYSRLLEFEIEDASLIHFNKCGHRELMIDRRKMPLVKIKLIGEVK